MGDIVRACADCGKLDLQRRWKSVSEALDSGVMDEHWACPNCAWPSFELAAVDDATQREPILLPGPSAGERR